VHVVCCVSCHHMPDEVLLSSLRRCRGVDLALTYATISSYLQMDRTRQADTVYHASRECIY